MMRTIVVEELSGEIRELVDGWIDGKENVYILRNGEPYAVFYYREPEEVAALKTASEETKGN